MAGRPTRPLLARVLERVARTLLRLVLELTRPFRASRVEVDLPDLETESSTEIIADNVRAASVLYRSTLLEEMRFFQVVDGVVEMFSSGRLPLGRGPAGGLLHDYMTQAPERLSEAERLAVYGRALGVPGGDPSAGEPNREFNPLFLQFIQAVSAYVRETEYHSAATSAEHVRKAGRDLAVNLSLHGSAGARWSAQRLRKQIDSALALLADAEVLNALGARDHWQVIDQVAERELGASVNVARVRAQATAGTSILEWVADRTRLLLASAGAPSIDMATQRDRELADAVERWLAAQGDAET